MRRFFLTLATLCSSSFAESQALQGTADITITSRTPNAVVVEEKFVLQSIGQRMELRLLIRPCMVIDYLRVEQNGNAIDGVSHRHGPWLTWRDTASTSPGSSTLMVRYTVWLGGSRTVPLMYPIVPLARVVSGPQAVTVRLRFPHDSGLVEFPHFTRQAANEWQGQFVAIPAFIKVGGFAFSCDRLPPPGNNGGLVWRFALLVGIMVAWVPLYLSWARRSENA